MAAKKLGTKYSNIKFNSMRNILTLDGATIVIVKFWKINVKLICYKNYNLQQYLTNNIFLIKIAVN